jgi:hypothetical protein
MRLVRKCLTIDNRNSSYNLGFDGSNNGSKNVCTGGPGQGVDLTNGVGGD